MTTDLDLLKMMFLNGFCHGNSLFEGEYVLLCPIIVQTNPLT